MAVSEDISLFLSYSWQWILNEVNQMWHIIKISKAWKNFFISFLTLPIWKHDTFLRVYLLKSHHLVFLLQSENFRFFGTVFKSPEFTSPYGSPFMFRTRLSDWSDLIWWKSFYVQVCKNLLTSCIIGVLYLLLFLTWAICKWFSTTFSKSHTVSQVCNLI